MAKKKESGSGRLPLEERMAKKPRLVRMTKAARSNKFSVPKGPTCTFADTKEVREVLLDDFRAAEVRALGFEVKDVPAPSGDDE